MIHAAAHRKKSASRRLLNSVICITGENQFNHCPRSCSDFIDEARSKLKHELLTFHENDFPVIAKGLATAIKNCKYTCYACAIMPDHIHMLIRRHRDKAEKMIENCQRESRLALIDAERRHAEHPVWGGPGWKVFLNTRSDIERIVSYIEDNPIKARRPAQHWPLVTKYDGWMPAPAFG